MVRLPPTPADVSAATHFGFTPDGGRLFAGYQAVGERYRLHDAVVWWDIAAGRLVHTQTGPNLVVAADGLSVSRLLPGAVPKVSVTAVGRRPTRGILVAPPAFAIRHRVLPIGLAVTHLDRLIVHRLSDGSVVEAAKAPGFSTDPQVSPGGRWLLATTDRGVRLWDRTAKHKMTRLKAGAGYGPAAVSADDRYLAATGPTGTACTVWDIATKAAVVRIDFPRLSPQAVAWTPDGRLLVSAGGPVQAWDVAAGRLLGEFDPGNGLVCGLAVAPDGLTAAALGYADFALTPVVWDL